jgi:hypothetical protein
VRHLQVNDETRVGGALKDTNCTDHVQSLRFGSRATVTLVDKPKIGTSFNGQADCRALTEIQVGKVQPSRRCSDGQPWGRDFQIPEAAGPDSG